jgi:rhamnose transport system substrate-binding protein
MLKKLMTVSLLILLLAMLAACGSDTEEATPAPEATTAEEAAPAADVAPAETDEAMTYVFVPKGLGIPYFDTANKGAQEAAAELGVEVTYTGPATADATEQIQVLNSLIAQGVDGLAISANDADALVPTGKDAMESGIPVVSWDSAIAAGGSNAHMNQADSAGIARVQVEMVSDLIGGAGQIAILSATSTAPNQNEWIELMEVELAKPEFANLELVTIVYGDDEDEKSYNEAVGLMRTYPELKGIISPTTVGIAASARAVQDQDRVGEVFVTGLGTPNQMREYVESGAAPAFALWNPSDLGYLAIYALNAIATGEIQGNPGDTFDAGKLGSYTIAEDGSVLLGLPTVFDINNINDFDF